MPIDPFPADVGRRVLYRPSHDPQAVPETGVVTSLTESWVFVRYGVDATSKATARKDLEWEHGE